ncbi:hypothetical protein, partial [Enterobacter bugandensis]|uniref:hypothetical protein n=1 Tax=Enterobacter bugandensis TaxID=881260 RepID=UPI0019549FBB
DVMSSIALAMGSGRKKAAWSIACMCIGVLILTSSASATFLPVFVRYSACFVGGLLLLSLE